jgi:hypothetical protein
MQQQAGQTMEKYVQVTVSHVLCTGVPWLGEGVLASASYCKCRFPDPCSPVECLRV